MNARIALLLAGAALASAGLSSGRAQAQEGDPPDPRQKTIEFANDKADDEDVFKFDFGVPSSPSLELMGIGRDGLPQANSLKPVVIAWPGVLSKEDATAGAIEISPAWLIRRTSAGGYTRRYERYGAFESILYRTRIGGAISAGVGDADPAKQKPSKLAVSLSTSLLPNSDPLLASVPGGSKPIWQRCLDTSANLIWASVPHFIPTEEMNGLTTALAAHRIELRTLRKIPVESLTAEDRDRIIFLEQEIPRVREQYNALEAAWKTSVAESFKESEGIRVVQTCMRVADRAARVGPDFDIGGGIVWDGKPGDYSGYKGPTEVVWASIRLPVFVTRPKTENYHDLVKWLDDNNRWFMVGASAKAGFSEAVATGDATTPLIRANRFTGWAGLESYTPRSRFALQLGVEKIDPELAANNAFKGTRTVFLASFDRELAKGIWFSVSYGRASGSGALKGDHTTRVGLVFDTPDVRKIFGD